MNNNGYVNYTASNFAAPTYAAPTSGHLSAAPSYPRTQPQPVASSSASTAVATNANAGDPDDKFFDELDASWSEDSGSGDDYNPQEEKGKSAGGQLDQGLIRGALKPSRSVQYSCSDLNWWLNEGGIDLEAEYQRDVVWTESRQEGLIDSLFQNYFIPPVLFSVSMDVNGAEKRICMDGKQRLSSIMKFMSGQIPWRPKAGPGKGKRYWWVLQKRTTKKSKDQELPPLERNLFNRKQIVCAEFDNLTEEQQRDIFQRVQLGMALSAAEKLQALDTPLSRYVTLALKKHVTAADGIETYFTDFKKDRGVAWQNVANLIYLVESWPKERYGLSATHLNPWIKNPNPVEEHLKRKVDKVFNIYVEILHRYKHLAIDSVKKRLAPVEFSFIGLVIHTLRAYYSVPDLAAIIGKMRIWIRQKDQNIRSNTFICKELYNWLSIQPRRIKESRPRDSDEEEEQYQRKRARLEAVDGDYVDH